MISYRRSINTDPPALVEVWNDASAARGTYPLRNPSLLERWIFSKTYYCHDDFVIAVDDDTKRIIGFALVGFGPDEDLGKLNTNIGIVCAVVVRSEYRKRGIGRELMRAAEEVLKRRGATEIIVGSMWPANPYLFGLYGGSNSPGILASEPDATPFLKPLGYSPAESCLVLQKKLDSPLTVADTRFGMLRRRYDAQTLRIAGVPTWWHECVWGQLEPVEIRLIDKLTNMPAARAVVWELEGFSWKWNHPSAGILDIQVRPDLRKLGLGKLLLSHVLRFLQDQFFAIAELQVPSTDPAAVGLCHSLGFDQVDQGFVYRRSVPDANMVSTDSALDSENPA